jgi:hypothetical protein
MITALRFSGIWVINFSEIIIVLIFVKRSMSQTKELMMKSFITLCGKCCPGKKSVYHGPDNIVYE